MHPERAYRAHGWCARIVLAALVATVSACAPKLGRIPTGPGNAFPDFAAAYQQSTEQCRGVRSLAAVLAVSGRAAGNRLPRVDIDAGFEAPGKALLELPAPGRAIFTFAANGDTATLILPRDGRVLQDAPSSETLEALTGIALGPDALRGIVSGCGFGAFTPSEGRSFDRGVASAQTADRTAYLENAQGQWRLIADRLGPWLVQYGDFAAGRPATIRLSSAKLDAGRTDLTIRTSQVDINQPLPPQAFTPEVPAGVKPITLDELRQAGPLGR